MAGQPVSAHVVMERAFVAENMETPQIFPCLSPHMLVVCVETCVWSSAREGTAVTVSVAQSQPQPKRNNVAWSGNIVRSCLQSKEWN